MRPVEHPDSPAETTARPRWSTVLRAVREARGMTLDGWAARIGVSRATVQRWERGARAPDPGAEASILAYCRDTGLFRAYDRGPLAGLTLTAELLADLLAEARWRVRGGAESPEPGESDVPLAAGQSGAALSPEQVPVMPAHNPPAKPAKPPPANLPAQLTSFIGREREIAEVRRVQAGTRLLTLTGAGGCGKTRLALALAEELRWAYPHGVWWADLAPLADPALLPQVVASVLEIRPTGHQALTESLCAALASRHLLLVLDNCEHLLPACAEVVEALLRSCPYLEVVATSRESLGIRGETVWRVPTLSVPDDGGNEADLAEIETTDAVRLFVERARLHRPEFEMQPGEAATVAEICRELDGMPLAIELAAARVSVLSVAQIAERLHDRFRLLTSGRRTALPRQQTLRATMEWSYDLLTAPEQALFCRLSVFAGGFTLEAVEHVAGAMEVLDGADALDLLERLVEKSLVIAEVATGSPRYRMLETVRQFAAEELQQTGQGDEARACHLAWCAELVRAAEAAYRGPDEPAWLARLEQEHDNLRSALAWSLEQGEGEQALRIAAALPRFWELCGHLHEGRDWLARALTSAGEVSGDLQTKALRGLGFLAEMLGTYAAARDFHVRHLDLQRALGNERGIAEAQGDLGRTAARQGDHAVAREQLEASLEGHRRFDNKPGIASVQGSLGMMAVQKGEYEQAHACITERLALNRAMGNKDGTADALVDLAFVAGGQGDIELQVALLEESMALWRELNSANGIALALCGLGLAAWANRDYGRALTLLQEALALYRGLGDTRGIARALEQMSTVALYQREYAQAEVWCRESLARFQNAGDGWGLGRSLNVLAGITFGNGQPARAACLFGAAASLNDRLGLSFPAVARPGYERALAGLRRVLGEEAFAEAWSAGQAMDEPAALAYALSDKEPD